MTFLGYKQQYPSSEEEFTSRHVNNLAHFPDSSLPSNNTSSSYMQVSVGNTVDLNLALDGFNALDHDLLSPQKALGSRLLSPHQPHHVTL